MAQAVQRAWIPPESVTPSGILHLYNSLLDQKVPFVPRDGPDSKKLVWYCCGPTVYDVAHIGHARNYVTFDIIRRVLEDYFGYNITYVMNITDVDDKIILRARRNYLYDQHMAQERSAAELRELCLQASIQAVDRQISKTAAAKAALDTASGAPAAEQDSRKIKELSAQLAGEELKLKTAEAARERASALAAEEDSAGAADVDTAEFKDVISELLDRQKGDSVTDRDIYRAHAARYEAEFLKDMKTLNVRPAHAMPRVTDYMPQVVAFVQKVVDQGFAYAAGEGENKSVYFDVAAFRRAGHTYGKLKPWAVGSAELAAESESNFVTKEKRSDQDFALWKSSKAGEPFWDSPWGKGRPGWHIECSAMVEAVCGKGIDIHSGGDDLKFPHHDNEIAQSEAHGCGCTPPTKFSDQWCNYWLHSGHLSIDGLKMSKSLKNFITIQQALEEFSVRQLRLLFCLQPWHAPMTFNQSSRSEMTQKEGTLKNFFLNVQVVLRENPVAKCSTAPRPLHQQLARAIEACQKAVHDGFLDNINTPLVMDEILKLVSVINIYLSECKDQSLAPDALRVDQAARYITRILSVLGLTSGPGDALGFTEAGAASVVPSTDPKVIRAAFAQLDTSARSACGFSTPQAIASALESGNAKCIAAGDADAMLDELAATRDALRAAARSGALEPEAKGAVMKACDAVRDETLVDIGIKLEDAPHGPVWKRMDPEELRKEVQEKQRLAAMAAADKLEKKRAMKADELEKVKRVVQHDSAQAALSDRFRFNDAGDAQQERKGDDWVDVDEKRRKAIKKIVDKEEKSRAPITKKVKDNPEYVADLELEVRTLSTQLEELNASLT